MTTISLHNRADRKMVWQVFLTLLAFIGILLLTFVSNFQSASFVWILLWLVYWWWGVAPLGYIGHFCSHKRLFAHAWFNGIFNFVLGILSGMTIGSWKVTHVYGHHSEHIPSNVLPHRYRGMPSSPDELKIFSAQNSVRYVRQTVLKQWISYIGFVYTELRRSKFRRSLYRRVMIEWVLYWAIIITAMAVYPLFTLFFLLIPHFLLHVFSRYIDYLFRVGAKHEDPSYFFCFSCSNEVYNRATYNSGCHLVHHQNPRMHWSVLKQEYEELKRQHPEVVAGERSVNFSGSNFMRHWQSEMGREKQLTTVPVVATLVVNISN